MRSVTITLCGILVVGWLSGLTVKGAANKTKTSADLRTVILKAPAPVRQPRPTTSEAEVWSLPKPSYTNYSRLVQVRIAAAAHKAAGGTGYSDAEVIFHFPMSLNADGTTNQVHLRRFRKILDRQTKRNLADSADTKPFDPHDKSPRVPEPIQNGADLERQLMIDEGRVPPPRPHGYEFSEDVFAIGLGLYPRMGMEFVRFQIQMAQVEYLLFEDRSAAMKSLRILKREISDRDAEYLLRTSVDILIPVTEYYQYELPKGKKQKSGGR